VKVALFGHGGMGRIVAERARAAGHEIGAVLTSRDANAPPDLAALLSRGGHDVAIDFSRPDAVMAHVVACARAGVPLVEGTTGWGAQEGAVRRAAEEGGGTLVYGPNFSIGVHLFYRLVKYAGELFRGLGDYEAFIEEAHHAKKRDAPSGTALRLRDLLTESLGKPVPVASTRAGHIPGTHRVGFDSAVDQLALEHTARSRDGFAAGALFAAGWVTQKGPGRRGVFRFEDVIDDVLGAARSEPS
jgi:4-hydroxy-tetrahydrodipicolinate reductase